MLTPFPTGATTEPTWPRRPESQPPRTSVYVSGSLRRPATGRFLFGYLGILLGVWSVAALVVWLGGGRPATFKLQSTPVITPVQGGDNLFLPVDLERDRPSTLRGERERLLAGVTLDKLLTGLQSPRRLDAKSLAIRRDLVEFLIGYYRQQAAAEPAGRGPRQHLAFLYLIQGDTLEQQEEWSAAITAFRQSAELYVKLNLELETSPLRRYEAYVWHRLGAAYQKTDQPEPAKEAYQRALNLRRDLIRADPRNPILRFELATTLMNHGLLAEQLLDSDNAEAAYRAAIRYLQSLVAEQGKNLEYRQELARALRNLGRLRHKRGQRPEAQADFQQAVALQEQLISEAPQDPGHRRDLALSHFLLSVMHQQNGRRQEALLACRQALEQQRRLVDEYPGEVDYLVEYARSWHALGVVEHQGEASREAVAAFERALALQENLVRQAPGKPAYRLDLSATHHSLAVVHHRAGRRRDAKLAYDQARALQEKLFSESPQSQPLAQALAYTLHNLGIWYAQEAESESALTFYRRAQELRERLAESGDPAAREALACTRICLASALRDAQQWQPATLLYDRALAALENLQEAKQGSRDLRWWLRNGYWGRAVLRDRLSDHAQAVQDWDLAIAVQEKMEDDPYHELTMLRLFRAASEVAGGQDPTGVVARARSLSAAQRSRWGPNVAAAQVFARAAASSAQGQANLWAAEAVASLQRARTAGYFVTKAQVRQLEIDPVWKPLLSRDDFQQFRRSLNP
jgi:tetratricopeptide (TPR) repeat protein